ncbi:MAG: xanthine dehydrogenase small subunit [Nitratireductor sp.]|nr:xanthine dehydrogenase small subunit [Nitratireductor sp.]
MRDALHFLRNGKPVRVSDFDPDTTLLDYLRLRERKTGTKEGCNEGDCGACTVAVGRVVDGRLRYEPVNACIQLLGQIDGADVITVDDLAEGEVLHPVQQAMVDEHGSQCGFCTPGIVMSLFTLWHSGRAMDRADVNEFLSGNLCRCTGYRPIADAAIRAGRAKRNDALAKRFAETQKQITKLRNGEDLLVGDENRFFAAPASVPSLAALCAAHPDATILAGSTDVGLWITKQLRDLPKIIHVGRARGFGDIRKSATKLVIGAGATYAEAFDALSAIDPDLRTVLLRLGSRQVRASGTVGGNIANGSPIGDMPPMLIALGASLELNHGGKTRTLKLEDFFIDYGKQDRQPGELVAKIILPLPKAREHFRAYKISKRFDQDISAVMFALNATLSGTRIASARLACGGMAATPKRARHSEAALAGLDLGDEAGWQKAVAALEKDYAPISDMRASADYRMQTVKNLLVKALTELAGEVAGGAAALRVSGSRSGANGEARP